MTSQPAQNMVKLSLLFCVIIAALLCCKSAPHSEMENIRALLKQEQKAHLDEDVDLFTSEFATNMISVNRGELSQLTTDQHKGRITRYFQNVEFIKWEDTQEPIIRLSDDQTLAYAILQKQVIVISKGASQPDTTDFAWISVLRKVEGAWKVECNVSTNR